MTRLDMLLELARRLREARDGWHELELLVDDLLDDKLASEVDMARYFMLGAADRLDHLITDPTKTEAAA